VVLVLNSAVLGVARLAPLPGGRFSADCVEKPVENSVEIARTSRLAAGYARCTANSAGR
jgi:hypothetical protein